jgi:hypothetical protein
MKAFLISPESQSIETIEILDQNDIQTQIGYDTVISDELGDDQHIFFDEECFLRQAKGRFQIDKLVPISGKAVIMGMSGDALTDVTLDKSTLAARVSFS